MGGSKLFSQEVMRIYPNLPLKIRLIFQSGINSCGLMHFLCQGKAPYAAAKKAIGWVPPYCFNSRNARIVISVVRPDLTVKRTGPGV